MTIRRIVIHLAVLALAVPSHAEDVVLQPHYQVGDSYALALRTETAFRSGSPRRAPSEERVEIRYAANVVVLETDVDGVPIRERHEDVELTFNRVEQTGSLFAKGVAFDVHRQRGGSVEITRDGKRLDRALEKTIRRILATQFEYTVAPALVNPGRSVAVGETWEIDQALARKFLRGCGVRVIEFDGPATATLERDGDSLVVRYRIPIAWWKPTHLPANALVGQTDASVEGTIRLASDDEARPLEHASKLVTSAHGVVTATGYASPAPWSLALATSSNQSTRRVRKSIAANL